ncbi:DUF3995 domain-containing protein [Brevibacterium atlanticum]|uniref:DUF3995 domain-containing protein n=1 Tax=Brevibacterium atlanticum TaxID=2697563 RepID=UPI0014213660|nr:DUF3995 domain-containing protein [Brevibacterium atlanticum]
MQHSSHERLPLLGAAACGIIHAGFSLYWALGGQSLIDTLGSDIADFFSTRQALLGAVGIVKIIAACAPLALGIFEWPHPMVTRGFCWAGGGALVVWGGANTVIGNAVLLGAGDDSRTVDRVAMAGHAWLWDPLFLLWGTLLLIALAVGVPRHSTRTRPRRKRQR